MNPIVLLTGAIIMMGWGIFLLLNGEDTGFVSGGLVLMWIGFSVLSGG